jgi:hypothetical protein
MKPIKMFVLTLAALMAMAFVGASSTMAESTALCGVEESPCSEGNSITHIHETSVGKAKLKSSLPTIECNVLFLGDSFLWWIEINGVRFVKAQRLANPLFIVGNFTYSSCNNFCSVKEENGPAEIKVLKTGSELASLVPPGSGGEGLIHVSCPFINCNYTGTGLEGHGLGPLTSSQPNGSVVITEQETEKESGSCPEEAFLTITTTPLSATYIST